MIDSAAYEIKRSLTDVRGLLEQLGLLAGKGSFSRQAGGFLIRCPVHDEKTPSCSVQLRQGVVLWNCHGCGEKGDALSLVARSRGLSLRGDDFRQVLILGAELAGLHGLVRELETGDTPTERPPLVVRPAPQAEPEKTYPPASETAALLAACRPVSEDDDVAAWIRGRRLSLDAVEGAEIVFALPATAQVPGWASYQGRPWTETGHRLIIPMFDAAGVMQSVRAGRVTDGDSPKRLPPGGYRASGLVMACPIAVGMLRGTFRPERVAISEGEPDWIWWSSKYGISAYARIGITSGSWTNEIADRIPRGAAVFMRTDNDNAGDRYSEAIMLSLRGRCAVHRTDA